MKKKGPRASFFLSAALALVNTLIISVFLPGALPGPLAQEGEGEWRKGRMQRDGRGGRG